MSGVSVDMRMCQIRSSVVDSLQYQVRYEYNVTGQLSNRTDTLTYRVTSAWDRLQTQVRRTFYVLCK